MQFHQQPREMLPIVKILKLPSLDNYYKILKSGIRIMSYDLHILSGASQVDVKIWPLRSREAFVY